VIPRVTIVVTAYQEGPAITAYLDRLLESVMLSCEVLVVYDSPDDSTAHYVVEYSRRDPRVVPTLNTYGPGPAKAIRFGFDQAAASVVVVTMADGCDDPCQIEQLTRLVERGIVIAAASRYMRGGRQIGGPPLKSFLSRMAGTSLYVLARVGTHDATNSFKAYSTNFVREVGIESDAGFEVGIELVAKARRRRLPVAEVPTIWLERTYGSSSFKLFQWIPNYLRWYVHAFGPPQRSSQSGGPTAKAVAGGPLSNGHAEREAREGLRAAEPVEDIMTTTERPYT
jgi:dolichol-phosphate mannosyltransferase